MKLIKLSVIIALIVLSAELKAESGVRSWHVRSGMFNYNHAGIVSQSGSGSAAIQLEWSYYNTLYDATILSYKRIVNDSDRTLYQAFSAGVRYFPLNAAYSTLYQTQEETISYDVSHTFYTDISVTFGRYLISVFGNPPIYDLSSDFIGASFAAGWSYQLTMSVAFDVQVAFGYAIGFNSPVAFSASDNTILMGITLIYGNQKFGSV
ncbi:MAG: hypothetical protein H6618_00640 [Deltaproteobacteria bacterium]|nr:hypothetical protein [Deltaproteobacteria bacterium]